jgi:hypothetical protein
MNDEPGFSLRRFGFGGTILQALAQLAMKLPLDGARDVRNRSAPEARSADIESVSKPVPLRGMKHLRRIHDRSFRRGQVRPQAVKVRAMFVDFRRG